MLTLKLATAECEYIYIGCILTSGSGPGHQRRMKGKKLAKHDQCQGILGNGFPPLRMLQFGQKKSAQNCSEKR